MNYTYACDNCKLFFEKNHGMNENPSYKCKKCKRKLRRIITGGNGVIYKGDGWSGAGKKDSDYNRRSAMDYIHANPESDPYSGYRNWEEE